MSTNDATFVTARDNSFESAEAVLRRYSLAPAKAAIAPIQKLKWVKWNLVRGLFVVEVSSKVDFRAQESKVSKVSSNDLNLFGLVHR